MQRKKMTVMALVLGLILVAPPAMAAGVRITIDDLNDSISLPFLPASGFNADGTPAPVQITQESATTAGFVDWDFYFFFPRSPIPSRILHWNVYEPRVSSTDPLVISDTIEIIFGPGIGDPGTNFNVFGEVHFRSDSTEGGLLTPFTDGAPVFETGSYQTVDSSPSLPAGITVEFRSDVAETVPEPTTMLLLGSGLLGLWGFRKKFKK